MIRLLCFAIGYLFGLFQTGYIIGRIHGIDIREYGSGNAGTTNMIRTMGTGWGLLTFAGDFIKSCLAVTIVSVLFSRSYPEMAALLRIYAGAGAVIGHDFPFYLKFRGGKGVAATAGMIAAFDPWLLVIFAAAFFTVFLTTHYVSAGSLCGYASFFIFTVLFALAGRYHMSRPHIIELDIIAFLLAALCFRMHRGNLKRLAAGDERKTYLFHKT